MGNITAYFILVVFHILIKHTYFIPTGVAVSQDAPQLGTEKDEQGLEGGYSKVKDHSQEWSV